MQVELVRVDPEPVARSAGGDPVGAERPAQRVHVHLERAEALAGGVSPQMPSISRSVETTSLACRRSIASSARGRGPPSGRDEPSSPTTSSGPKTPNSTFLSPFLSRPFPDRKRYRRRWPRPVQREQRRRM